MAVKVTEQMIMEHAAKHERFTTYDLAKAFYTAAHPELSVTEIEKRYLALTNTIGRPLLKLFRERKLDRKPLKHRPKYEYFLPEAIDDRPAGSE